MNCTQTQQIWSAQLKYLNHLSSVPHQKGFAHSGPQGTLPNNPAFDRCSEFYDTDIKETFWNVVIFSHRVTTGAPGGTPKSWPLSSSLVQSLQGAQKGLKAQEVGNWGGVLKNTCCWINSFLNKAKTEQQHVNTAADATGADQISLKNPTLSVATFDFWLKPALTSKDQNSLFWQLLSAVVKPPGIHPTLRHNSCCSCNWCSTTLELQKRFLANIQAAEVSFPSQAQEPRTLAPTLQGNRATTACFGSVWCTADSVGGPERKELPTQTGKSRWS